ncbi:MAG: ACP S-malonyltransferase [Phycisphaeraceae bacterium]|nr:MAG: ACP S-malonyltransferase [Phycisphaeraceae bacterium]
MSEELVILCPGQGAQSVGMGKRWYEHSPEARAVFDRAEDLLGDRLACSLKTACFEGPAELINRTDVAQPALYVCGVASFVGRFGNPGERNLSATAGLSLGEYTALHLAGAFSFEDGLELVTVRGRAMQDAAEASNSGMVALIGADEAQADEVCRRAGAGDVLVPANYNAPGQIVLSGSSAAVDRAAGVADAMGLRAAVLAVAGAFHSPLMAPAGERLREVLERVEIREPRCPVLSNVTGVAHGTGPDVGHPIERSIRDRLVEQLTAPVRWAQGCAWLVGAVSGAYHELAPGKVLSGLMRRIDREVKVASHADP